MPMKYHAKNSVPSESTSIGKPHMVPRNVKIATAT